VVEQVWNPAFDVTPAHLIHGIITEKGVIPRSGGAHDVRTFLASHGLLPTAQVICRPSFPYCCRQWARSFDPSFSLELKVFKVTLAFLLI
jgi:Initiation factor 2 subunit family